jgi:hypothetical protein
MNNTTPASADIGVWLAHHSQMILTGEECTEIKETTMSEFCYLIAFPDGTCLNLSDEGPRTEGQEFSEKLEQDGFHHEEERPMGDNVLRVYKKSMPATDIVPAN